MASKGRKAPLPPADPTKLKTNPDSFNSLVLANENRKKVLRQLQEAFQKIVTPVSAMLKDQNYKEIGKVFLQTIDVLGPLVGMDPKGEQYKKAMAYISDVLSVPPQQRAVIIASTNYSQKTKLVASKILQGFRQSLTTGGGKLITGAMRSLLLEVQPALGALKLDALKQLKSKAAPIKDIYKISQQLKDAGLPQFSVKGKYQYSNPALMKFEPFQEKTLETIGKNVYNTLQIPVSNHLQAYPQWIINRNERRTASNAPDFDLINRRLKDPNDVTFLALQNRDNSLAYFDSVSQEWGGKAIDKLLQKQTKVQNFSKRYATNSFLYDTKLTQDQLDAQVPLIVKDIVAANDNLSTAGFGPVNSNSLALYAGRWMDTTTGTVRILPNASTKYINPLSSKQRLGYLQARILNHWNNLVKTAQQYNNLNNAVAQKKYQSSAKKALQRGFDPKSYKDVTNKMIQSTIDDYIISDQLGTQVPDALTPINKAKKVLLDAVGPQTLQNIRRMADKPQVEAWKKALQKAYDRTMSVLTTRVGGTRQGLRVMSQITSAYLSLVDTFTRKVKGTIKRFIKSKVIPQSLNQVNILSTVQNYQDASKAADQWLYDTRLQPADTKKFIDSLRSAMVGTGTEAFKKLGQIPQSTVATYGSVLRGLDQKPPAEIKSGVKPLGYIGATLPPQSYGSVKQRLYRQLDGLNTVPIDVNAVYPSYDENTQDYKNFDDL